MFRQYPRHAFTERVALPRSPKWCNFLGRFACRIMHMVKINITGRGVWGPSSRTIVMFEVLNGAFSVILGLNNAFCKVGIPVTLSQGRGLGPLTRKCLIL